MKNLQYDSLYKFLVSIGLFLVGSPFFLLVLILNLNDLVISQEEFLKLTDTSQNIIAKKQEIVYRILSKYTGAYLAIAISLIIIGLIVIITGIILWYRKSQKSIDDKQKLENDKLINELKITKEEEFNKTKNKIEGDKQLLGSNADISPKDYLKVENEVYQHIVKLLYENYNVIHGAKIGNEEYDIIATGRNLFYRDYIFEVKYIKSSVNENWFNKLNIKIKKAIDGYKSATNRLPKAMIIIVTEEHNYQSIKEKVDAITVDENCGYIIVTRNLIGNIKIKSEIYF